MMITFDRVRLAMLQGLVGTLFIRVVWPDVGLLKLTVLLFLFQVIFTLISVLVYVYWPDRWSWTWTKSEPEKAKNGSFQMDMADLRRKFQVIEDDDDASNPEG